MLKFYSEKRSVVTGIIELGGSVRMRNPDEKVHLKDDPADNFCCICGCGGFIVWVSSSERWAMHPSNCQA